MNTERILAANEALMLFVANNTSVISEYERLKSELETAECELKEMCRNAKEGLELRELGARYVFSQPYRKVVSYEIAREACGENPEALNALQSISTITVDPEMFIKAVQEGLLPNEVRVALQEEPLSPRITKTKI